MNQTGLHVKEVFTIIIEHEKGKELEVKTSRPQQSGLKAGMKLF